MPIKSFPQSHTFVAYMDISGFKSMMNDGMRAPRALNDFYNAGFCALRAQNKSALQVEGIFVSDCGILFVRGGKGSISKRLEAICRIIQQIHQRAFEKAIQLTTSISWGEFSYHNRIEFPGIEKNLVYGNAYVEAFKDNENGEPKLYPSECRLRRKDLPDEVAAYCKRESENVTTHWRETPQHFYFEWMRP
jgi:hypothetical protein